MIRCATITGEQANRRHVTLANGTGYWRSDLIVSAEGEVPAPQAFLIQQDPGTVIRPHFHAQDQFQVVAEGGGTLGRHAVSPIHVHYASRHTGYGPITAGRQGLSYFTFRAMTTPYAYFLPESRAQMENLPKRNLLGHPVALSAVTTLCTRTEAAVEPIIEPQPDGVAAWLVRLPANATFGALEPAQGGDRFYLVGTGAMIAHNERLPRFATAFVSADEHDFALVAGDEGLEALVLQFPARGDVMPSTEASGARSP
jgi:hypothetical protein